MKTAFFSSQSYDIEYFNKLNKNAVQSITYFETALNKDTTELCKGFDAVCIFVNDNLDKETIEKIAKLGIRLIALRCAGFNNVDIETARENNVTVLRVPAYSPESVAEHAVALILTLARRTHKAYNRVRDGNYSLQKMVGFMLHGKTVGVIGTGRIGAVFCKIMHGFGCNILAHDAYQPEELKKWVTYKPLTDVLKASDIISLHCPLTPQTKHLINKESIAMMKEGVMLINTSRGAVINTTDVIDALQSGRIGYLGIDVYEQEENIFFRDLSESMVRDDMITKLVSFPNVLITAHEGFFTKESLEEITVTTLQNFYDFENGIKTKNEVLIN